MKPAEATLESRQWANNSPTKETRLSPTKKPDLDGISTDSVIMLDGDKKRVSLDTSTDPDIEAGQVRAEDPEFGFNAQKARRKSGFNLEALKDPAPAESDKSVPEHRAFFVLGPENPVRIRVNTFIWYPWFDRVILGCICISSILIAVEDPVNPAAPRNLILNYFDYVFSAIFISEMLLKWVALGFVLHPRAYLRNAWNVLDFVVVMGSVISIALAASGVDVSVVRVIRVIRVLRPLRTIQRAQKLKEVVSCFIASVVNLTGISMLFLLFLFLFGVMGVQLFKGGFYFCDDPLTNSVATCVGNFTVTDLESGVDVSVPRVWSRHFFNFDNVGEGLSTLFSAATGEGWPATLYRSIDARGENLSPLYNYRPVSRALSPPSREHIAAV